jgi:hypothetical protein
VLLNSATVTINNFADSITHSAPHAGFSQHHDEKNSPLAKITARSGTSDALIPCIRRPLGGRPDQLHVLAGP